MAKVTQWASQTVYPLCPGPLSHRLALFLLPLCMCLLLSLMRHLSLDLGPTWVIEGGYHLKILHLITSAKTLFPKRVTFIGSGGLDVDISFGEPPFTLLWGVVTVLSPSQMPCQRQESGKQRIPLRTVPCAVSSINVNPGNSLGVWWLGLHTFTAEGLGSIPGWGTKISRWGTKIPQVRRAPPQKNVNPTKELEHREEKATGRACPFGPYLGEGQAGPLRAGAEVHPQLQGLSLGRALGRWASLQPILAEHYPETYFTHKWAN